MITKFFSRGGKRHEQRMREARRRLTAERRQRVTAERLEERCLLANTVGVTVNTAEAFGGYTLFAPSSSTTTYLIDQRGNEVKRWTSSLSPMTAELQADGSLIRAGRVATQGAPAKQWAPGVSGRIEKFNWNGDLVWSYTLATPDAHLHHDFEVLPNGNIVMIAWERKTYAEAVQAGRHPDDVPVAPGTGGVRELWPDMLIEVRPNQPAAGQTYAEGGEIVWRWNLWDHMIQDIDPTKDNYGNVAANPQRVDVNYYIKGDGMGGVPADWTHFNSVAYNPELDQLVVSSREFSEVWIIDHSTTTAQAAGRTGGRSGKGGDILWRWGNPAAYKSGTAADQKLFYQHDAHWIRPGLPGAGNMLIFNNGWNPDPSKPSFSSIVELTLPANPQQWHLADSAAGAVRSFHTGVVPAGWAPLTGDWDGDGRDSVGFYDPAGRRFHLYPATADGETQPTIIDASGVGAGTWLPIRGDWDGDGTDTVGLYNPATNLFKLSNAEGTFAADAAAGLVEFAASHWRNGSRLPATFKPLAGDWDGDGRDNVGLYSPASNHFWLTFREDAWAGSVADGLRIFRPQISNLLPATWLPLAGDWNGDGVAGVGFYDPATRTFQLHNRLDGAMTSVITARSRYAGPAWRPITGDWDGDGRDSQGTYNPAFAEAGYAKQGPAFGPALPTWQYVSTPRNQFYATIISGMQRLPNGNTLINEGTEGRFFEVTPAGKIVWQYVNPVVGATAANVLYQGQRPQPATAINIPGVSQNLTFRAYRYAADFPGLVGRDLTPGNPVERYSNGADTVGRFAPTAGAAHLNNRASGLTPAVTRVNVPPVPAGWQALAGDWNGPAAGVRRDAIGMYNAATRQFRLYPDNQASAVVNFAAPTTVPSDALAFAGDFDGDGIDSVSLFSPLAGTWFINNNPTGWTPAATFATGAVPVTFRPLAGDWDGDGRDGIAFYDPTGRTLYFNNRTDGDITGVQTVAFTWAGTNWIALAGDWDGDGRDTVGFIDPTTSTWRLSNKIDGSVSDLIVFQWILAAGWQPLAGNWDGVGGIAST